MAKSKNPGRNPFVRDLRTDGAYRPRVAKNRHDREKQRDGWDRDAKHKAKTDLDETLQVGDEVKVEVEVEKDGVKKKVLKTGMVKNPHGPGGLAGITVDGKYNLIPEDKVKLIDESFRRLFDLSK